MPYIHYDSNQTTKKDIFITHSRAVYDFGVMRRTEGEDPLKAVIQELTKVIMGYTAEALPFQIMVCPEKSQNSHEIYQFVDEWITPLIDQYCEQLRSPNTDSTKVTSDFLNKIKELKDKYAPSCNYSIALMVTHSRAHPSRGLHCSGFVLGEMAIAVKGNRGYKEQSTINQQDKQRIANDEIAMETFRRNKLESMLGRYKDLSIPNRHLDQSIDNTQFISHGIHEHDEIVAYSHSNKKITDPNSQKYEHFGRSTAEQIIDFRKCDDGTFEEVSLMQELIDIHQSDLDGLPVPISYSQMILPEHHERTGIIAPKKYQAELTELITLIPSIKDQDLKKKFNEIKKILSKAIDVNKHTDFYYNKVLSDTIDLLKCRPEIREDKLAAYKKQADSLTGHESKGLKKLGYGMLALAAVFTFGIGSVPGIILITASSTAVLTSIGAFAVGRKKDLSKVTDLLADSIERVGCVPLLSK
jgi:hypothetical protein